MKIQFFLVADSAALDARTNRLSLFHLMEEVQAASFPIVIQHLTVATFAERERHDSDKTELKMRWSIDGEELAVLPVPIEFQGKPRARNLSELHGVVMPKPGECVVELRSGKKLLHEWKITLSQLGKLVKPATEETQDTITDRRPRKRARKLLKRKR
jgi:Family of unknown function (DUF6941)